MGFFWGKWYTGTSTSRTIVVRTTRQNLCPHNCGRLVDFSWLAGWLDKGSHPPSCLNGSRPPAIQLYHRRSARCAGRAAYSAISVFSPVGAVLLKASTFRRFNNNPPRSKDPQRDPCEAVHAGKPGSTRLPTQYQPVTNTKRCVALLACRG